mgnify:CR=1 FL=1
MSEQDLPPGYDDNERLVLRFLQGLKWDNYEAYHAILTHSEWQQEINKVDPTPYIPTLNKGILYGMKRDRGQRPVIIANVRRMIDTSVEVEELQ